MILTLGHMKTFQQIVQVGGRAGRRNLHGEVLIQTLQPDHPVIKLCTEKSNSFFIDWELASRKRTINLLIQIIYH